MFWSPRIKIFNTSKIWKSYPSPSLCSRQEVIALRIFVRFSHAFLTCCHHFSPELWYKSGPKLSLNPERRDLAQRLAAAYRAAGREDEARGLAEVIS